MFVGTGILGAAMGLSGYLIRDVREVQEVLPDHDAVSESEHMRQSVGVVA